MRATTLALTLVSCMQLAAAEPIDGVSNSPSPAEPSGLALLTPPPGGGPVVVRAHFELQDIADINVGAETFECTGVLTLEWKDPRQAFDPATEGLDE